MKKAMGNTRRSTSEANEYYEYESGSISLVVEIKTKVEINAQFV
jgi:hypothetical protein